eukprot:TRINITY_DN5911_c1_g1_i5.p2 TRINITY_DN5911_c1_g1~~TRINITY_DN5911_c1_g1_i5.p2  ORF type:complete len:223 (+),score=31.70 TRINITY_DN5911_c1_g1_i5:398-1066(+)
MPTNELESGSIAVASKLGSQHWLVAAFLYEQFRRHDGETDCQSVFYALQFFTWLSGRSLTAPPFALVEQLFSMADQSLAFLFRELDGVRDLRNVFLRSVELLREYFKTVDQAAFSKLGSYAGHARNIQRNCAYCGERVGDVALQQSSVADGKDPVLAAAEIDGCSAQTVEDNMPKQCSLCKELIYCDLGCQKADMPRHRSWCIPSGCGSGSPELRRVMAAGL